MLAAYCLLLMPAAIQIALAPDQPVPIVYADDPLIIEFLADTDVEVEGQLYLQSAHTGGRIEIALGRIYLHGGAGHWHAVHDAPRARGFYTAEIVLAAGDDVYHTRTRFCRVDRPAELQRLPLYAHCSGEGAACQVIALKSIGVETVRLDVDHPQLHELIASAVDLDLHVVVTMSTGQAAELTEETIALLQAHCENILRFDLACDNPEPDCRQPAELLRPIGCPAGVSVTVTGADAFEALLRANPAMPTRSVTLVAAEWPDAGELRRLRQIAAHYGHEGWQTHVVCPNWRPGGAAYSAQFIHHFMRYRSEGLAGMGLNASIVADEMGVLEMMAYLNGLALRFIGCTFVGPLPAPNAARGLLFRTGSTWFATLWSDQDTGIIHVPIDGAVNMHLTDALGNSIPLPDFENGRVDLTVGQDPLYLTGQGGVIFGRAAEQQVHRLAAGISEQPWSGQIPQGVVELIAAIAADPRGAGSRLRFLDLLRQLPNFEEQWHARRLERHVALPAIAALSELARTLCVIEEDRGEHFLEPLADTLARTEELQSLYLTGSAGTARSRERGDWILGEVRRLVDEAETLDGAGRKIEACAVAALAEWRAHGLKFAAQAEVAPAPVTDIRPLTAPETTPETEDKDEAPGDQDEPPEKEQDAEPPRDRVDMDEADGPIDEYREIIHRVTSGENPYSIARKYSVPLDDLLEWNNMRRNVVLRIGQELKVRVKASD